MFLLYVNFCAVLATVVAPTSSTKTITTSFCFPSFFPTTCNITYSGDAMATNQGFIQFSANETGPMQWSSGRATYGNPIKLYDNLTKSVADFSTHFTFLINTVNGTQEADGITFFLAKANSTLPLHSYAGFLGLVNGDTNGLPVNQIVGIEFDTWLNLEFADETSYHIGVDVNSVNSTATVDYEFEFMLRGEAWIRYQNSTLFVRMRNKDLVPSKEWKLSVPLNLTKYLPELIVVGFSASSGAYLPEMHRILTWDFTSILTIPDNSTPNPNNTSVETKPRSPPWLLPVVLPVSCFLVFYLGVMLIVAINVGIRRRRANREKETPTDNHHDVDYQYEGKTDQEDDYDKTGESLSGKTTRFIGIEPERFSYAKLEAATDRFSEANRLGEGGSGGVYKGVLEDGRVVAVKRFEEHSRQGRKQFLAEVTIISKLRHPNLVRLIGWSNDRGERLIAYEYMERGSLDHHLFSGNTIQVLPWTERTAIAKDVASALLYLHEGSSQYVVHRDVKSSNVMIDSGFRARLGDFGLARAVNHGAAPRNTMVAGTVGYLAPECITMGNVGKESDVYSFGVVLLEIVCGRRAFDPLFGEQEMRLREWVWRLYAAGRPGGTSHLLEAVDKRLGVQFIREEAHRRLMVGLWCTLADKERRPTIRKAIKTLSSPAAPLPTLTSRKNSAMISDYNMGESGDSSGFGQTNSSTPTSGLTATTWGSSIKS